MIDIFDLTRDEHRENPFPLYARMRAEAPILWSERLNSWFLTRYRDCVEVLRDVQHFGLDGRRVGAVVSEQAINIQSMDPPAHTPVRNLFISAYRAQDFAALASLGRQRADRLLDALMQRREADLIRDYAMPLSLEITCDFLGVDCPDAVMFSSLVEAVSQSFDAGFFPELRKPGEAARAELSQLIESWGARSREQGQGFMGYLLDHHESEKVSRLVVLNSIRVGLLAGYMSTSSALGNLLKAIVTDGVPRASLFDREISHAAIDEMFRYEGPVQGMMRLCYEDVEIGGQRIRRGQAVTLMLGAANRDPDQFERPDEIVLDRAPNPHLAFGWGLHACIGSSLTKLIIRAALSQLAERAPALQLREPISLKRQISLRAPQRVMVGWE